ncbi:MAG TPA: hypothetical protein VJ505_15675 [Holophagaceae bacterium]|nr:hypothetical protein [Holophagaceae bacterium]
MKFLSALLLAGAVFAQAQTIAIVNRTTSVSDATLKSVMNSVAQQVHNEWKAKWGTDATFVFVGKNQSTSSSYWNIYVGQTKGDYHTVSGGTPVGYVHVKGVTTDYWTNSVSHEVLEMRGDPYVNTTYTRPNGTTGYVEVCDACETNAQGYRINSILMSDFVYPSWFKASGTKPFDYRGLITAPFQVLSGGYLP